MKLTIMAFILSSVFAAPSLSFDDNSSINLNEINQPLASPTGDRGHCPPWVWDPLCQFI